MVAGLSMVSEYPNPLFIHVQRDSHVVGQGVLASWPLYFGFPRDRSTWSVLIYEKDEMDRVLFEIYDVMGENGVYIHIDKDRSAHVRLSNKGEEIQVFPVDTEVRDFYF